MPAKKIEFPPDAEAMFQSQARRGASAGAISKALRAAGFEISPATIGRRLREQRGSVRASSGAAAAISGAPPPKPSSPEMEPTDEDIEEAARGGPTILDEMLTSFVASYRTAEPGPVKQRWGQLILKGLDDRRKATPPEPPDPNDNPDMMKLGAQVAERLHKMIDAVTELEGA